MLIRNQLGLTNFNESFILLYVDEFNIIRVFRYPKVESLFPNVESLVAKVASMCERLSGWRIDAELSTPTLWVKVDDDDRNEVEEEEEEEYEEWTQGDHDDYFDSGRYHCRCSKYHCR